MIKVTRLRGEEFYINCDKIEFIESTPDTVVSLTTGNKVVVRESPEQLLAAIKTYRAGIGTAMPIVLNKNEQ